MTRIEVELSFAGHNTLQRIDRYDETYGFNIRGFMFRLKPFFFSVVWRSTL